MSEPRKFRIGVDLGGTKTEAILLDAGNTLWRRRTATPSNDYAATLRCIMALVAEADDLCGEQASVGIGIPGTISPDHGRVKNANSVYLIGQDLKTDLETCLHRPVRVANDADCFALSEGTDGAGAGYPTVFGVIIGTGCGGGILVNGTLLAGPNAIAGEWGHNPLPWRRTEDGPVRKCYCGKQDCLETFLSGPGLTLTDRYLSGKQRSGEALSARAAKGDGEASAILAHYADQLARGLASVANILDPHAIVLGGGLSNLPGITDSVGNLLARYLFSDKVNTAIVRHQHGDSSGVRGAAWLWR
ncbi:ROK family protein [Mangrovitalea sediminis]|uniref:ROK family protein n=1 Tax=Mangrovitalea sediminis TaxID=1982043 RepID=UPI000BE61690|nr:ROK family protein [Mangrovitalea sediminis]